MASSNETGADRQQEFAQNPILTSITTEMIIKMEDKERDALVDRFEAEISRLAGIASVRASFTESTGGDAAPAFDVYAELDRIRGLNYIAMAHQFPESRAFIEADPTDMNDAKRTSFRKTIEMRVSELEEKLQAAITASVDWQEGEADPGYGLIEDELNAVVRAAKRFA